MHRLSQKSRLEKRTELAEKNIQKLFTSITAEQAKTYLESQGWEVTVSPPRMTFAKQWDPSEGPKVLLLPSDTNHPKFVSMVPNIVFTLAVLTNREAMDIAEEMASTKVVSNAVVRSDGAESEDSRPSLQTFRLVNGGDKSVQVSIGGYNDPLNLAIDQGILIRVPGGEIPTIRILDRSSIEAGIACPLDVRLDLPKALPANRKDVIEALLRDCDGAKDEAIHRGDWLGALWEQYAFSIETDGAKRPPANTVQRAAAIYLVHVAEKMELTRSSAEVLYEVARYLVSPAELLLPALPSAIDQLWLVVRQDSPSAPRHTMHWFVNHTSLLRDP